MRQRDKQVPKSAEETVRDIRRATRRQFSAEEKIRIALEGLRGEDSIAELCRKEGIAQNLYYRWSKEFLEAGKKRLAGDTAREATSDEVKTLRARSAPTQRSVGRGHPREPPAQKKRDRGWGGRRMRYVASEKLENHQNRRDLAPPRQAHARQDRHPQDDFLRLARSLRGRRPRRSRRPQATAEARLEPHPR